MVETNDDEFLTRREAVLLVSNFEKSQLERFAAHNEKHLSEHDAIRIAMTAVSKETSIHAMAHEKGHDTHEKIHQQEQAAVKTALDSAGREHGIHATAHDKAHHAHDKEHELDKLAITKAEVASDIRFSAVNAFRAQLNDLIRTLASKETVDSLVKNSDRRFEEFRGERERRFAELSLAITNIEKGDVKAEGKGMGQSAIVAIIVTAVGLVGAVLSILIVAANALSA